MTAAPLKVKITPPFAFAGVSDDGTVFLVGTLARSELKNAEKHCD